MNIDDVEEVALMTQLKYDKVNWSCESNNYSLCQMFVEQKRLGNYIKGTMSNRGYKMIEQKFKEENNLHHDKQQFGNKIRQLKGMYNFIKGLHNKSGLGRDANDWPVAPKEWWDDKTKGHAEWKKLKHGPPDYLPMLEELFEGVAVDGSTSYVVGQSSDDADEDEEAADLFQDAQDTPVSTGSLKRASSTSTTGTSLVMKSKSPVIKMMRDFLSVSSKQVEEQTSMI